MLRLWMTQLTAVAAAAIAGFALDDPWWSDEFAHFLMVWLAMPG